MKLWYVDVEGKSLGGRVKERDTYVRAAVASRQALATRRSYNVMSKQRASRFQACEDHVRH